MGFSRGIVLGGLYLIMILCFSSASVVIDGGNFSVRFEDIEANFAPPLGSKGLCGKLYISEPVEACSPLSNKVKSHGNCTSPIALIIRGECSFEQKIRRAQDAGFEAAIIYDNEDGGALVAMAGNSAGILIHAVFVSKVTGQKLKTFVGSYIEVWMLSGYESSVWSIMAISFISLLAMSAVLATCFFVRRHRIRRERPRGRVREFHGMSSRLVKAMPSLVFTAVTEENCTASTCAICLEDYLVGDKLRILPCRHKFHTFCVDTWLTTWRTFCPVCKRDARTITGEPPASESTPLLSSNPSSLNSSPFSSFRSSSIHSSAIQISSPNPRAPQTSRNHSITRNLRASRPPNSSQSQCSPSMSITRSSLDLRNMSSQRSYASRFISPGSMGYPSMSTRYGSPYIPSPSNGSSSYLGSASMTYPTSLHYSESAPNFSPYNSAQSLPEC